MNKRIAIRDIVEDYLRHKLKTDKSRQAQLLLGLCCSLGHLQPQDITPKIIAAWRSERPHLQDSSARRELGALISALRWGARHKLFLAANIPAIDLPPPGEALQLWMALSQEEFVWSASQKPHRTKTLQRFVPLALDTAARKTAILRLDWSRVDLGKGLVDYREPGARKTNKRRIPVPVNARLRPVLEEAWNDAPKDRAGQAYGLVVGTRNIDREFSDFADDIGLPWVTPHVCRHTWACLAAQAGMPMFHIARMLGDTLATVEKNYAHLAPDHLTQVANWRFAGKAA